MRSFERDFDALLETFALMFLALLVGLLLPIWILPYLIYKARKKRKGLDPSKRFWATREEMFGKDN